MPLWGNFDNATGNQKPVFANTSNTTSHSTIHGETANLVYGNMIGVSTGEKGNSGDGPKTAHAGWVSQKIGTGPIVGAEIVTRGQGINVAGSLVLTDGSQLGLGTGATITYTICNVLNTLATSSSNHLSNGVKTVTITDGGSLFSNSARITAKVSEPGNTVQPTFTFTLGGRGDRVNYETIVAVGSITGDDSNDDGYFPGT